MDLQLPNWNTSDLSTLPSTASADNICYCFLCFNIIPLTLQYTLVPEQFRKLLMNQETAQLLDQKSCRSNEAYNHCEGRRFPCRKSPLHFSPITQQSGTASARLLSTRTSSRAHPNSSSKNARRRANVGSPSKPESILLMSPTIRIWQKPTWQTSWQQILPLSEHSTFSLTKASTVHP